MIPIWAPNTLDGVKKIGSGSYGSVYLAKIPGHDQSNSNVDPEKYKVAVKRNLIGKQTSFMGSIKELDILARLRDHPFMVTLQSISLSNPIKFNTELDFDCPEIFRIDDIYFNFECGAYDGRTLINGGHTSYSFLKLVMCQMFLGIEYMHSRGIIHMDLKPDNLLWFRDGVNRIIKICDFGLAKYFTKQEKGNTRSMTAWYRAPEVIFENDRYDAKVDIWSAGCILFEMIARHPLLENPNKTDNPVILANKILNFIPEVPSQDLIDKLNGKTSMSFNFSIYSKRRPSYDQLINLDGNKINVFNSDIYGKYHEFLDLLYKCLAFDPNKRATATEVLNHKFFDSFRSYINQVRTRYPPTHNINNGLNPKLINYEIVNTIERVWAINLLNTIIGIRKTFANYSDKILFFTLDLFDRYLVYLYKNGLYNKEIPFEGTHLKNKDKKVKDSIMTGPFHNQYETELRVLSCFYIALKFEFNMVELHSFDKYVAPSYKTPDALKQVKDFELLLITVILQYKIYRPTLYQTMDIHNIILEENYVLKMFQYMSSDEFVDITNINSGGISNDETLFSLLNNFIEKHPHLNMKINKRIKPKVNNEYNEITQRVSKLMISSPFAGSGSNSSSVPGSVPGSVSGSSHVSSNKYVPVVPISSNGRFINLPSTRAQVGQIGINTMAGLPSNYRAVYQTVKPINYGIGNVNLHGRLINQIKP